MIMVLVGAKLCLEKKNTVSPAYGDGQNILTPLAVRCKGRGPFKKKQTNLEKIVQRLNKGKNNMKTLPSKENARKDFHSLNFEEGRNMLNASNAPAYDHLTIQESITSKKMRGFNMKNSAQPSFAEGIQKTIHKKSPRLVAFEWDYSKSWASLTRLLSPLYFTRRPSKAPRVELKKVAFPMLQELNSKKVALPMLLELNLKLLDLP
ncbi:hypothetical protein IFM89_003237 [Coptis chinensis]|uniref:Uncharacterized protein n=1 Tax=Coptis chinensis TaxID=261450 RepID=A0A835H152_9MAGN|nr:hypothetical protein IFM89_003237 [Coptis chinensis]